MPATVGEATIHVRVQLFGDMDMVRVRRRSAAFPPHMHDDYVVAVLDAGRARSRYRNAVHHATAGDLVVIEPHETHGGEPADCEAWGYRAIYPSAALMARAADFVGLPHAPPSFPFFATTNDGLVREFRAVFATLEQAYCPLKCETVLAEFLARLVETYATGRMPARTAPRARVQELSESHAVARAQEHIEAEYSRPMRMVELTAAAGVGEFQLIRAFHRSMGMPPYTYLVQRRIAHAQRLLRTGCPVSEVAYSTGFCDQSHLTRHFRRIVGVTPGQYARRALVPAACTPEDRLDHSWRRATIG